jgi:hypothetical protein
VAIAILNDWRRGLYVFVTWILFEGFVRKYLGNDMAAYFAKDPSPLSSIIHFSVPASTKKQRNFASPFEWRY